MEARRETEGSGGEMKWELRWGLRQEGVLDKTGTASWGGGLGREWVGCVCGTPMERFSEQLGQGWEGWNSEERSRLKIRVRGPIAFEGLE